MTRHSPCILVTALCCLLALATSASAVYGGEPSGVVRNLRCITPHVHYNYWRGGQTLARDSDAQDISNALFVAIKAKLPRLLVTSDCQNGLHVIVSIIESTATCLDGFEGDIRLSLRRTALVTESKQLQNVQTWAKASRFWGPTELAKQETLRLVEGFVNAFAADYYSDGNP